MGKSEESYYFLRGKWGGGVVVRMSACFRGKLKNSRRCHSSKNKKIRERVDSMVQFRMETPGTVLLPHWKLSPRLWLATKVGVWVWIRDKFRLKIDRSVMPVIAGYVSDGLQRRVQTTYCERRVCVASYRLQVSGCSELKRNLCAQCNGQFIYPPIIGNHSFLAAVCGIMNRDQESSLTEWTTREA